MDMLCRCVQWYNRAVPLSSQKGKLTRMARRRLSRAGGVQEVDGIWGGSRMRLDLSKPDHQELCLNFHELTTVRLLRRLLRPGDGFVDAGANVGYFTLIAAGCVGPRGRVYSFEPNDRALEFLRANVELNGLSQVTVFDKACSETTGDATLYTYAGVDGMRSYLGRWHDGKAVSETVISTVRIDEVAKPPIKAMKVDVDGAEWPTLRGSVGLLNQPQPPHLIVELTKDAEDKYGVAMLDMIDWIIEQAPSYRMHVLERRRVYRLKRDELAKLLAASRYVNLWFEPTHA